MQFFVDLDTPLPVRGIFSPESTTETLYTTERYQSYWFRNWYQRIRKSMSDFKQRLGFTTSNVTTGLDTDRQFFYGTKEPFKDYVLGIFPGITCNLLFSSKNYHKNAPNV